MVFEEATNDRNYSLEMDDSDNLSVKVRNNFFQIVRFEKILRKHTYSFKIEKYSTLTSISN